MPSLPFDNQQLLNDMTPGDRLVLADGGLQFRVRERLPDGRALIEALGNGIVTSRKGLALPGKTVALPALTDKDRKNLAVGLELGVDAVAVSFVQSAEDIRQVKSLLRAAGRALPVVAKLERRNAVENLDAVLAETDMVMVARGDLGVECPLPELPALQKRIIRACNAASKPVVVATQMLLSMVNSPVPTRAETTDVANAVLDGADCVMLSEETAMGNYPVETVAYMRQIAAEAESYLLETRELVEPEAGSGPPEFLAYAACLLAEKTGAPGHRGPFHVRRVGPALVLVPPVSDHPCPDARRGRSARPQLYLGRPPSLCGRKSRGQPSASGTTLHRRHSGFSRGRGCGDHGGRTFARPAEARYQPRKNLQEIAWPK